MQPDCNPFDSAFAGAGYASHRPPLHRPILERALAPAALPIVDRALDVGCGAGLSTRALDRFARCCVGVAPNARFAVGRAEALPFAARSFDLLTAAGSLNYVSDLDAFFHEASRLFTSSAGRLLIYDFRPGCAFRNSDSLERWFESFVSKYPWPASEARPLNPDLLAGISSAVEVEVEAHENFRIGLTLTPEFYLNYMLTESNVAFALRRGAPREQIRAWCEETLATVWQGQPREVVFPGYWARLAVDLSH